MKKVLFYLLSNGEVLIPFSGGSSIVSLNKDRGEENYSIGVTNLSKKSGGRYLRLGMKKTASNQFTLNCIYYRNDINNCEYEVCPPTSYNLNITRFDDEQAILSGTFNIDIPASGECPALKITEGRFDIQFYY